MSLMKTRHHPGRIIRKEWPMKRPATLGTALVLCLGLTAPLSVHAEDTVTESNHQQTHHKHHKARPDAKTGTSSNTSDGAMGTGTTKHDKAGLQTNVPGAVKEKTPSAQ
ncbi:Hypothetical protein GbCGDNIH2_0512 [Granulibacter bethesdensis]|nr:Hypothetical protein GbCGDNIH2_0512 [Granulibacter bethesdensis]